MDIQKLVDGRNSNIKEFQSSYDELKSLYTSSVLAAIDEKDPAKQQELIQTVLNTNAELVAQIREMVSTISSTPSKYNSKTIHELTEEIIEYQTQHQELNHHKDRISTLEMIATSTHKKLSDATTMFNIYLFALIALMFLVFILVVRSSYVTDIVTSTTQAVQSSWQSATQYR